MANSVQLLQEYLLTTKCSNESEKDVARELLKNDFEDLEKRLANINYWNYFLNGNFDADTIKRVFLEQNDHERSEVFKFGIACFVAFTQENFTKPTLNSTLTTFLQGSLFQEYDFRLMLTCDNEEINNVTLFPILLVAAKIIFNHCLVNNLVNKWWCLRTVYVHQQLLDEQSLTLFQYADMTCEYFEEIILEGCVKASLDLEIANLYLLYRRIKKVEKHTQSAAELLNLTYDFVGVLGKRTKYQENETAQLTVKVTEDSKNTSDQYIDFGRILVTDNNLLPANLKLDDDVRLENVALSSQVNENLALSSLSQKLLLTLVQLTTIAKPSDEFRDEEQLPFIDLVLGQSNTFCIRILALLLRSKAEAKNRRTIERALKQIELIHQEFTKSQITVFDRFNDVFSCGMPAIWKVTSQYADLLLNIGLPKEALNHYLELEQWENVIVCYTIMQLRHKAAEIIKQQLEKRPTVKLWCLLGDATDDVSCYEKAWKLSHESSHRAQRHWGNFLFDKKQYEECISHYELSVSINPLQEKVWFRLGFAARHIKNLQLAARAYKRYTFEAPNDFTGWNNLAEVYLALEDIPENEKDTYKLRAHQALTEALKCNFEFWKVWESFMVVSMALSKYSDVIRAYHRLLDLKGKYLNTEVLEDCTAAIVNSYESTKNNEDDDAEKKKAESLLRLIKSLLGRVTSVHPGDGILWDIYAQLAETDDLKVQRLQRSLKGRTKDIHWSKDAKLCNEVLSICHRLGETILQSEMDRNNPILGSVKLSMRSAYSAITKQDFPELQESLGGLANTLELIKIR